MTPQTFNRNTRKTPRVCVLKNLRNQHFDLDVPLKFQAKNYVWYGPKLSTLNEQHHLTAFFLYRNVYEVFFIIFIMIQVPRIQIYNTIQIPFPAMFAFLASNGLLSNSFSFRNIELSACLKQNISVSEIYLSKAYK